jgi:hypothetical protein
LDWVAPDGATTVYVEAVAGGGGGACEYPSGGGGAAGNSGASVRAVVPIEAGRTYTVQSGAAGLACIRNSWTIERAQTDGQASYFGLPDCRASFSCPVEANGGLYGGPGEPTAGGSGPPIGAGWVRDPAVGYAFPNAAGGEGGNPRQHSSTEGVADDCWTGTPGTPSPPWIKNLGFPHSFFGTGGAGGGRRYYDGLRDYECGPYAPATDGAGGYVMLAW